jgi:diaminohydroxyphosphoribosylaminopyrimidine deaminase/5-amino-6-(5-phosphoribosylamino)uracil reductase
MNELNENAFMERALDLAKQGEYTVRSNPLVGCVLVKNGEIVGEGLHWQEGQAHAEVEALRMAREHAKDAICYVTLEPCSHTGRTGPCVEALIKAGIKEVVFAVRDPDPRVNGKGIAVLQAAGITVREGLLEKEAREINKGFFSRILRKRPYVRAKMAISLDGRVAMKDGESQWITSNEARQDVHHWRAKSGAILTSGKTVERDQARLTVRDITLPIPSHIGFEPPLRVILDRSGRVSPDAPIFQAPGRVEHIVKGDFDVVLSKLQDAQINYLWVEAGPTFMGALLEADLIDEWIVYMAPKWLGHEAMPMIYIPGLNRLSEAIQGQFKEVKTIGNDLRISIARGEKWQ